MFLGAKNWVKLTKGRYTDMFWGAQCLNHHEVYVNDTISSVLTSSVDFQQIKGIEDPRPSYEEFNLREHSLNPNIVVSLVRWLKMVRTQQEMKFHI